MITQGTIRSIVGDKCEIYVDLFANPGDSFEPIIKDAVMLVPPGFTSGYSVGDKVFIDFQENSYSDPVIVGRIYEVGMQPMSVNVARVNKDDDNSIKTSMECGEIKIYNNARIPITTKFGEDWYGEGGAPIEDLSNLGLIPVSKIKEVTIKSTDFNTEDTVKLDSVENLIKVIYDYSTRVKQLETEVQELQGLVNNLNVTLTHHINPIGESNNLKNNQYAK